MAKFCGNCGAQMNDDANVCGMCGTPFAGAQKPGSYFRPPQPTATTLLRPSALPVTAGKANGTITILCLVEALLFVVLGILNFTKMFSLNIFYEVKLSLPELFGEEDVQAIPIIVGIILFIAAILSFVPVITAPKKRRFIFQIIAALLPLCLLGVIYISIQNADSFDSLVLSQMEMLFSGWLYLLISFVNIALSVLVTVKSGQ